MATAPIEELQLPEQEFQYLAGPTERPWHQFVGRWKAIKPKLADIFQACGNERPLRLVDVGSCNGFFSLQAAHCHPEADVIGIEGSVGIGNGVVGMAGSAREILRTRAVQTHLRWIRQLSLQNCMVAPEVWDYDRIVQLASEGRPIADVAFMLSVIHHIDGVSQEQYANAGLSKADGLVDLLANMLALAPNHFVELPYKPWLPAGYEAFNSQRGMLEAASKKSQYEWNFVGPLYSTDWFGPREVWLLQVKGGMPSIDLASNPFYQLISDVDPDVADEGMEDHMPAADAPVLAGPPRQGGPMAPMPQRYVGTGGDDLFAGSLPGHLTAGRSNDPSLDTMSLGPLGGLFANDTLGGISSCQNVGGNLQIDPAVTAFCGGPSVPVEDRIGDLLQKSPTPLLVAHLVLREAMNEAHDLLAEVRGAKAGLAENPDSVKAADAAQFGVPRPIVQVNRTPLVQA